MNNKVWNEEKERWEDENGKRICTFPNETIDVIVDNCKEFLEIRNKIYIEDVVTLMEKALEGVGDKKDLVPSEQDSIKRLRKMIKGL